MIGPPACNKRELSDLLVSQFGLVKVSTADLLEQKVCCGFMYVCMYVCMYTGVWERIEIFCMYMCMWVYGTKSFFYICIVNAGMWERTTSCVRVCI